MASPTKPDIRRFGGSDGTQFTMKCFGVTEYGFHFSVGKTGSTYVFEFYMSKSPTCNCQLYSIGAVQNLFAVTHDPAEFNSLVRAACAMIGLGEKMDKLILLDVNAGHIPTLEKICKVIQKTPYVSTNDSKMCAFLVRLSDTL